MVHQPLHLPHGGFGAVVAPHLGQIVVSDGVEGVGVGREPRDLVELLLRAWVFAIRKQFARSSRLRRAPTSEMTG